MFSSVLIGDSTLVLQCADLLLARGHRIDALVSTGANARQWAASTGVTLLASTAELDRHLGDRQCDYLFSVVNYRILGPEILKRARHAAINYHDSPLPRYAGIHATAWAILAGEKEHGITWHLIVDEIDAGDILVQRAVAIDENETSLTLNIKCYEAATAAFVDLVDGLAARTIEPRPQDLSRRTYFARHRAPPGGGIIDWTRSATEVARFVRALDFGPYENTLGSAKIRLAGRSYLCTAARDVAGRGAPGLVLRIDDGAIVVACGSGAVELTALKCLDGSAITSEDVVARSGLRSGTSLPVSSTQELEAVESAVSLTAPHERFWIRRLATLAPAEHPFLHARSNDEQPKPKTSERIELPGLNSDDDSTTSAERVANAVSIIAEYAVRVAGEAICHVAYSSPAIRDLADASGGLIAAAVPFRLEREGSQRFAEAVRRTQEEIALVDRRLSYSLDAVARAADPRGSQVSLPLGILVGDSAPTELPAPITFVFCPTGAEYCVAYDESRLDAEDCARIIDHVQALAENLASDSSVRLSDVSLLSPSDRDRILLDWNSTAREYPHDVPLASLVEAQVERTPNTPAVTFGDETISYAELNGRANRLARELVKHGAGPDVFIGLAVERSIDMMVALLAINKSGAAYVPLDPMFPKDRLASMIEDSGLPILITQSRLASSLPAFDGITLDLDAPSWQSNEPTNLGIAVDSDRLALVIYTSGSTGRPKGVEITRKALINLLWSMREWLALTANDRLLAVTTISFDIAGADIWLPWLVGAQTIVATREAAADGERLKELIRTHDITFLQATPITWRQLLAANWTGKADLQAVCTGEAMPPEVAAGLVPRVGRLWNLYGPTETTIWSTGVRVSDGTARVSIGHPVANTQCYILDEYRQPVPAGVTGELYIAGDGLARGYLNRPDLTAEKFVANPFATRSDARMYRTGDLARHLPDGTIECLGRTDHQVKIRGFRIELGEIESVLRAHSSVRQAVVIAREDLPGDKRLVGYVVAQGTPASSQTLRAHLKEHVPDYMVPAAIMTLETIPLTANGKIDRRSLPAPVSDATPTSTEIVGARSQVERQLSEIWEELFTLPRVSIKDNFFDLGGHSILAVQLMAKVARVFGKQLPLNSLFESPTIEQLAKHIEDASLTLDLHHVVSIQASGTRPPVFWIPGGAALGMFRLRSIVTKLGPDQPVYGLGSNRPPSLDDIEGVEERARKYVELVRRVRPHGPYSFVGFCAGGLVAYEMAQQLTAAGERVPFVGLINCPHPRYPRTPLGRLLIELQRRAFQLREARSRGVGPMAFVRSKLVSRQESRNRAENAAPAKAQNGPNGPSNGAATNSIAPLEELLDAAGKVFGQYRPRPYAGAIWLLNSDDEAYQGVSRGLDRRFAWTKHVGRYEVLNFAGGHHDVFDASAAGSFGETLREALGHADAQSDIDDR